MTLTKPVPDVQPFVILSSPVHGLGGFATRDIRRGERIGEYVGERISQSEADRRYDDESMENHHTFLFTVSSRLAIDAAVGGNDTRLINHSCDPNCDAVIEDRRVFIDARRAIPKGAELFYDYAYDREPDAGPEAEAHYPCRCGTSKCRNTILAPARKRKTKPHSAPARQSRKRRSKSRARR